MVMVQPSNQIPTLSKEHCMKRGQGYPIMPAIFTLLTCPHLSALVDVPALQQIIMVM